MSRLFSLIVLCAVAAIAGNAIAGENPQKNQSTNTQDSRQSTNTQKSDTNGVSDSQKCAAVNSCK
jgi:hypothetical protein